MRRRREEVWGREVWGEAPIPLIVRSSTIEQPSQACKPKAEAQRLKAERATTTKQKERHPKYLWLQPKCRLPRKKSKKTIMMEEERC
jgi:hypothetical protein